MPSQLVTTQDNFKKMVIAQTASELSEAVVIAQADKMLVAPNINNRADGNKIVTPYPTKKK